MGLATGPDRLGQLSRRRGRRHVRRRRARHLSWTIDTVACHGAGRVVETVVSGRVRYSARADPVVSLPFIGLSLRLECCMTDVSPAD